MQAAVYRMTYFQHYFVTRKFTLNTDTHVKTLNRLQLKMTELSPEIRYIEGKKTQLQISKAGITDWEQKKRRRKSGSTQASIRD
jgi:hypothetical protein